MWIVKKKEIPAGDWLTELKSVVRGEVSADPATLERASTDASIFKVTPLAVIAPKDVNDVKALVKFVSRRRKPPTSHHLSPKSYVLSLTARSGGTDMTGGPLTDSLVVDFTKHFNRIKKVAREYAVVEPGVFYRDFEKETDARGVMLPSYPASKSICTVGGMVANNSGGEKTLAYGKTEDYVKELKAVFADGNEYTVKSLTKSELAQKIKLTTFEGEIYRKLSALIKKNERAIRAAKPQVSKNSSGYYLWNVVSEDGETFNLPRLIVGSQGTLCLVTEITFRLIPKKKYSRLAVVFLKDLAPIADIAKEVLKYKPESFESYDDQTLNVALKFLPDLVSTTHAGLVALAFRFLPEFFMFLKGGMPKLVLLIELAGDGEHEVNLRAQALLKSLERFGMPMRLARSGPDAEKYWTIRRESFNLLRHHAGGRRTVPFIDDVIVRLEYLPQFLPRLNAILEPYRKEMIYTIAGHVGDGNFHIIPLMDLENPESKRIIPEISEKVYRLVLEFHGSITAEHNDGLIRTPYVKLMYGENMYALFRATKKIFDPLNIFNPGKKVGGDQDRALERTKSR